uniref:Uncharacterized protein n=1 Tax=Picea glauca TaxID=3330 RepID=A0A101M1W8_PICGL|nr:hypothetical protein ABT39_MTgene4031 [Picea glauca]
MNHLLEDFSPSPLPTTHPRLFFLFLLFDIAVKVTHLISGLRAPQPS